MSLCHLRYKILEQIIKYKINNNLINIARNLHCIKNCKSNLILPELTTVHSTSFKLCANEFSTTNELLKSKAAKKVKNAAVNVNLNEISEFINAEHMLLQFTEAIEKFKDLMIKNLSLRTQTGTIETLLVTFEGEQYTIQELAQIHRKPNMVVLNASSFPQVIPNILESLRQSHLNLNPTHEGVIINIPLPKITKEHRQQLAKSAKQYFVKCKEIISDIRNENIKKVKKYENISEDLVYKIEGYINALQKEHVSKAEEILKMKQKELLGES